MSGPISEPVSPTTLRTAMRGSTAPLSLLQAVKPSFLGNGLRRACQRAGHPLNENMGRKVKVLFQEWLCWAVAFLAVAGCNGCAADDPPQSGALASGEVPASPLSVPVTTVGTLRPTFQWDAPDEPEVSYDFIICVGVKERHGFWVPGKTAYYRGSLKTTKHTIDQPLLPNTVYVWSVRSRAAGRISNWAAYSDSNPGLFRKGKQQYNILCPFKTPIRE